MPAMTWEEIDKDWGEVQRKCRRYVEIEEAEAIVKYCVGHSMNDVAKRINMPTTTVRERLDLYATSQAQGTRGARSANPSVEVTRDQLRNIINAHGPTAEEQQGDDFGTFVDHYKQRGHLDSTAQRLARAEWAAEAAIQAGDLKEDFKQEQGKTERILFPNDEKDSFELDLQMHMSRVKQAAKFLDDAKVRNLRRKSTCEKVAEADELWRAQAELVLAHFQPS